MTRERDRKEEWRKRQQKFYSSIVWQNMQQYIIKRAGGLCEDCLAKGRYVPATLVHHIKPVTSHNITDPDITLNPDNLRALCEECHRRIHRKSPLRYTIDENGNVTVLPDADL